MGRWSLARKLWASLGKLVDFLKSVKEVRKEMVKQKTPEPPPIRRYANPALFRSKLEREQWEKDNKES